MTTAADRCPHSAVYRDPLVGGYGCAKCHERFAVIPDVAVVPPRAMGLWARLVWALTTRKKVPIVDFVWSHAWGRLREFDPEVQKKQTEAMGIARRRAGDLVVFGADRLSEPKPITSLGPDGVAPIYRERIARPKTQEERK